LRYTLISAVIGVGIVLLLSLSEPSFLNHREILGGALMGVAIGSGSILMELAILSPLLRLGLRPALLARCASYFVGGAAGFWVGLVGNQSLLGAYQTEQPSQLVRSMVFYGVLAIGVGLSFYRVESLRASLALQQAELREKEFADRELETARLIQRRLMPPEQASGSGFRLAASNRAARFVAGDFYDYFHLPDGTMGFAIADVAGKGIGASLQMATVKAVLPLVAAARVSTGNPVAGTLDDLNQRLHGELGPREFVALLYGRFDPEAGTMEFANAGLPDPYWITDPGSCEQPVQPMVVDGERLPLGVRSATRYQSLTCSTADPGLFLLLTDGLVERTVGDAPLGYQRFESILVEIGVASDPAAWMHRLQARLNTESGGEPEDDDCTLMVLRCEGDDARTESGANEPKVDVG